MYNNWQNSQLYAGPVTLLNLQRDMCNLPVIKVYRVTDVIRLFIFSLWDPLQLQTNRVLCAKLKNFNSKPVQIQFHASDFYNSSRRLAISEPLDK